MNRSIDSGAAEISAAIRADANHFADFDKWGNARFQTGFQRGIFLLVGCGGAFNAWRGVGDLQIHRLRQFIADNFAVVIEGADLRVGFEIKNVVAEHFPGDGLLIVGLQIHQDVAVIVGIEVFNVAAVKIDDFNVIGSPDALINDCALAHVAEFELYLGAEVARGVVVGVGDDE